VVTTKRDILNLRKAVKQQLEVMDFTFKLEKGFFLYKKGFYEITMKFQADHAAALAHQQHQVCKKNRNAQLCFMTK